MEFTSPQARARYDAVAANASGVVVGLDFDGVLSPIVDDPEHALIHPEAPVVLRELGPRVRAIAVVTGRPARQAIALGGLDAVGVELAAQGREFFVFGQYGNERWSATDRRVISPRPPAGLAGFERDLSVVLRSVGADDAFVEEKGLAVAVHTRRLSDPAEAFDRLLAPLTALAERHGLVVEPGRSVIEVRAPGKDKGDAVRTLAAEQDASGFVFAGDDLGDVEAFRAVVELREQGLSTLLICSASEEQAALVELADVVVDGPDGVVALLRQLAADSR